MIDSYEVWTTKRMYTTKNIGHKNIIDYIILFIYLYSLDINLCI